MNNIAVNFQFKIIKVFLWWVIFPLIGSPLLWTSSANAKIIFEGYYKILAGTSHIGFVIQRYEYFPKSKEFGSTYFIQTGPMGRNIIESLKARADKNLMPLSYGYTSLVGDKFKFIDAQFTKSQMIAIVSDGKVKQTIKKDLAPNTFLSTFLGYAMLNQGFAVGKKFTYKAIAEEKAQVESGSAYIENQSQRDGQSGFQIMNKYAASEFINFVSLKGDTIYTAVPANRISTQLVAHPKQATASLPVSNKNIKTLFGNIPQGRINPLAQAKPKKQISTGPTSALQTTTPILPTPKNKQTLKSPHSVGK